MAAISKRIFDTDNALKGSFNGLCGRWQLLIYSFFVFAYAVIIGWINRLPDFNLLFPSRVQCNYDHLKQNYNLTTNSLIQRLSGKPKYRLEPLKAPSETMDPDELPVFKFNYSNEYGQTVLTEFNILCDLSTFTNMPRFSNYFGFVIGSLVLSFASDRGGRKMIILGCIWTTGIMSLFQLVGHDFISYVFFQFFLGLFIGGVQSTFLPAIIEMFPINFRTFYGVFFHLFVCLFEILIPWLAKSFKSWKLLQTFVTVPLILTAGLQWLVYESIFWYLAHKEYDKAIQTLTKLAKRNNILFESKFKQAKEFLHAKHSKSIQVDILPLMRLQDVELLGKKYPQVDMAELQKQKANSSKFRRFLNSLKGHSYRSTNTIYRPFDFIYSPSMLVYVLILGGLWFTNGLTDSMEKIRKKDKLDFYTQYFVSNLPCLVSSVIAIVLSLFKIGRRWMIFLAYLVIEVCFLGSLITEYSYNEKRGQTEVVLLILYHLCKFSTHFGFIFLMLITAELFPTSLRCSGMGICFILKMTGSLISSPFMLNYNTTMHRLTYCLLTLFFGSMTLFLPETKTFPLPRSILQIEAMPTTIGKKLRSRKVKLACERRQNQYAAGAVESNTFNRNNQTVPEQAGSNVNLSSNTAKSKNLIYDPNKTDASTQPLTSINQSKLNDQNQLNQTIQNSFEANNSGKVGLLSVQDSFDDPSSNNYLGSYDTVTSVHDIEQDDHHYYNADKKESQGLLSTSDRKLAKILEVPSKNITRNNSISDATEFANSKL